MANPEDIIDHEVPAESWITITEWFDDLPFSEWRELFDDHHPGEVSDRSLVVTADSPELPPLRIVQARIRNAYSDSNDVVSSLRFIHNGTSTLWQYLNNDRPSWAYGYKDRDLPVEVSKIIAPEIEPELEKLKPLGLAANGWLRRIIMPTDVDRRYASRAGISVREAERRRLVIYKNELETEAIIKLYKVNAKSVVPR